MNWEQLTAQNEPILVTKRYKVTTEHEHWLTEMETKYHIPPSSLVRMALDFLKPKLDSFGATEEGIVNVFRNHHSKYR